MLLKAHRAEVDYCCKEKLKDVEEISEEIRIEIRKQAFQMIAAQYKIENADQFVFNINCDEWKFTEPFTLMMKEKI